MSDVTVNNPKVQIDLANNETTTVPTGQRYKVSLISAPAGSGILINGSVVTVDNGQNTTAHIRTDLFGGDTIGAFNGRVRIRGYRVD